MQKRTSSPFRRGRRTTAKKRQRIPNKRYRSTTNSTEGTKNLKQHEQKISRSTGHVQKRAQQGHAHRRQVAWMNIRPEQKTIPEKKRKKKIQKGIASSRRRTLSGEVAAGKNKSRRGNAREKGETWMGMQRDYRTNQKRRKKKNMMREFTNSRQGTLSGEIKAWKTKMSRHWPQARWLFTEEGQENLPNRQLRYQRKGKKQIRTKSKRTT